jgi:hypothetical protein
VEYGTTANFSITIDSRMARSRNKFEEDLEPETPATSAAFFSVAGEEHFLLTGTFSTISENLRNIAVYFNRSDRRVY